MSIVDIGGRAGGRLLVYSFNSSKAGSTHMQDREKMNFQEVDPKIKYVIWREVKNDNREKL